MKIFLDKFSLERNSPPLLTTIINEQYRLWIMWNDNGKVLELTLRNVVKYQKTIEYLSSDEETNKLSAAEGFDKIEKSIPQIFKYIFGD